MQKNHGNALLALGAGVVGGLHLQTIVLGRQLDFFRLGMSASSAFFSVLSRLVLGPGRRCSSDRRRSPTRGPSIPAEISKRPTDAACRADADRETWLRDLPQRADDLKARERGFRHQSCGNRSTTTSFMVLARPGVVNLPFGGGNRSSVLHGTCPAGGLQSSLTLRRAGFLANAQGVAAEVVVPVVGIEVAGNLLGENAHELIAEFRFP